MPDAAAICLKCGVATGVVTTPGGTVQKSHIAYILFGIFLGCLGVHNFYAGYAGRGIAQLLISLFLGWLLIPILAVVIWIIIELCTVRKDAHGVPFAG